MAAFTDVTQFAKEFSIRTQLNYFNLRLQDRNLTEEDRRGIEDYTQSLHRLMAQNGYIDLDFCCGTQLINSVLGLLVFPKEQDYKKISKYKDPEKWSVDFPVLSGYIFSDDIEKFMSTYKIYDKKYDEYRFEDKTPMNILTHMRNAVGHKRISLYPVQENNTDQVTHIVFCDENKDYRYTFTLKIEIDDFESIMLEISKYFIRLNVVFERNRIKDWHRNGRWDENQWWIWRWD